MKLLDKVKAILSNPVQQEPSVQAVTQPTLRTMTDEELEIFVNMTFVPTKRVPINSNEISNIVKPVHDKLVDKVIDSERIFQIAPEVEHASAILIPSILAPNDFKPYEFSLVARHTSESQDTVRSIVTMLNKFFGETLGINESLSDWINDALFIKGAKPVMVLPESVITNLRNSSMTLREGVESLCEDVGEITVSCEDVKEDFDQISLNEEVKLKDTEVTLDLKSLSVTDSLYVLNTNEVKTSDKDIASNEDLDFLNIPADKLKTKRDDVIDISDYIGDNNFISSIIELPYEAVIPIIVEGSPKTHIGYFVVLNKDGIPVAATNEDHDVLSSFNNKGNSQIKKMFDSFYGNSSINCSKSTKSELLSIVFNAYLKKVLKTKVSTKTDMDVDISFSESVSKLMLYRILNAKKTRLLYVPKELLFYLAFWTNSDGTGKSKIDNIKFPLSLKLNLILSRLMALSESAINNKKLSISFNDNMPNPFEFMQTIRSEYIKKHQFGLTYDPNTIITSMADRQLTFVPNNLPGVNDFSIETEGNQIDYPTPDDSLLEEINNMYLLSLDIPPNALNRLSEDEFSSSVVTNNIFLANKILLYQRKICSFMTSIVRTFIMYSSTIKEDIEDILKEADSDSKEDLTTRMNNIVRCLYFSLPAPNISNIKTHYEEMNSFMDTIDYILEILYSEEVVDRDSGDDIKMLKALVKRKMLLDYIKENRMFNEVDIPDIQDLDIDTLANVNQIIANVKKMLADMKEKFAGEGGGSSGSSW